MTSTECDGDVAVVARRPMKRIGLLVLLGVGAAVAVVIGVSAALNRSTGDPEPVVPVVPAGHVHGLGVNEADGSIMVASHGGLFRVDSDGDGVQRVGDSYRDMMGFAVIGPDEFVASGHPDVPGILEGDPGLLGLLRSTDGGSTWQSLSLRGEGDLHELVPVGDELLTWDATSSEVMLSKDLQSWESRSTVDDLTDLAVDPDDADRLLATTASGTLLSADGGRTWEPLDAPPGLVQVAWSSALGLFGLDGDGVLWAGEEPNWSRIGEVPGEPQVLAGEGSVLLVAVTGSDGVTEVHRSVDAGRGWSEVFRDAAAAETQDGPS